MLQNKFMNPMTRLLDDLSELHTTSSPTSTLHHSPATSTTSTNTATSTQQLPRLPGHWTVKLRAKLELPVKLRAKLRAKLELPVKLRP